MKIYISKTNDKINAKRLDQELLTDHICLNPNYKSVTLKRDVNVLMDSGAFQDRTTRVSFQEALDRQLALEKKVGVISERIVAYDLIGDPTVTHQANIFLNSKRDELEPRQLVFMIQGNDFGECKECFDNLYPMLKWCDCVGIGGVALSGTRTAIREKLVQTFEYIAPMIAYIGASDIHVFGVGSIKVLDALCAINAKYGDCIDVSCDTSSAEIRSVMGYVFSCEDRKFVKTYTKAQKMTEYHPCDVTRMNISNLVYTIGEM